MAKKAAKAKEPIRLREKVLSNGNKSLYLDIYRDGKRVYEFLKLYLIPETASDPTAKIRNKQTLVQANAIKAQRIIELTNNEAGVLNRTHNSVLLTDWIDECIKREFKNGAGKSSLHLRKWLLQKLVAYKGDKIRISDIDKAFCLDFIDYLRTTKKDNGSSFSNNTIRLLTTIFSTCLNEAVRENLINKNPFDLLTTNERPKQTDGTREYLTPDEVERLKATPCRNAEIKQAFLFACYCGLRISDIKQLTWENIETIDDKKRIAIVQKKTKRILFIPLSKIALSYLPNKNNCANNELVFKLPAIQTIWVNLQIWAANAGITKNISFHVSRHTFATSLLTLGADLYTTSKLLGHTNIATTQIYAKIVDKKKEEAMNLFDKAFSNDNK